MRRNRLMAISACLGILILACAPPQRQTASPTDSSTASGSAARAPIRVVAAITGNPPAFVTALSSTGLRGIDALQDLLTTGLAVIDNTGSVQPRLAESIPSIENGQWRVFPDGRMETTWKIRAGAVWHDGTPFTAEDVLFTTRVQRDRELPVFVNTAFASVDDVAAPDAYTVLVTWKRPYIDADKLFTDPVMPRHLLESTYLENKAGYTLLPYWTSEFVGSGPFKLRDFVPGSHLRLDANDRYVLGRPRIDVLEVRIIPEPSTVVANLLAGEIELTLGKTLSVEQSMEVGGKWQGRIDYGPSNFIRIFVQHIDPNPPIVTNVEFKRAVLHGIDRQQLVDTLLDGQSQIAHSFMFPGQDAYREIEARLPRYDYDPRKTAQMIEGLGYARGNDGLYRDRGGQPINLEIRSEVTDINKKAALAIVDGWQRLGLAATPFDISAQASASNEHLSTFPAMWLRRAPSDVAGLKNLYSTVIPLPENNYRSGNNSRYASPELDAMLDQYFGAIPKAESIAALGRILYFFADQLPELGLFFDVEPTLISGRLANVSARWPTSTQAWNAERWEAEPRG